VEEELSMKGSENAGNGLDEMTRRFSELAGPGSKTAMGVLLFRFAESRLPEGQRICYDPYAVHFINPDILEWAASHPEEARAMHEKRERLLPGLGNSTVVRVRFFDDFVKRSMDEGFKQLVILGAGYDSRAYRMEGLKKITIFEVDHPVTQAVKMKKIKEIFGSLPDHVVYVPADLGEHGFGQRLLDKGYDRSWKTLFLMEGLSYYLLPEMVDEILSFITGNSGRGSCILFDYLPQSVVDGSCELEAAKNIRSHLAKLGEPLLFGIEDGAVETFLTKRGFSKIQNVTSEDYKKAYFQGINEGRIVLGLLSFAHAVVE
jgi:methyltransferase (TIGR00027 family)